jgi:hypothetical protein
MNTTDIVNLRVDHPYRDYILRNNNIACAMDVGGRHFFKPFNGTEVEKKLDTYENLLVVREGVAELNIQDQIAHVFSTDSPITDARASFAFAVFLTKAGTAYISYWRRNFDHLQQLNTFGKKVSKICVGVFHFFLVADDGEVFGGGDNSMHQISDSLTIDYEETTPILVHNFKGDTNGCW